MQKELGIKVIHVHIWKEHKNYYFGSISAVYRKFDENILGVTKNYLQHLLTDDNCQFINHKVLIVRSRLIR